MAVLSVARGAGKSALSAGLALGALVGVRDPQPRREIVIAARTRDQARIARDFVEAFTRSLPVDLRARMTFRRSPRLEIEFEDGTGSHVLRAIAADAKSALGGSPTFVLMDERGHWPADRADALEDALLSGMGKRGGRAVVFSTCASDDAHPFSRWIDHTPPGTLRPRASPPRRAFRPTTSIRSCSRTPARGTASAPRPTGSRHRRDAPSPRAGTA